MRIKPINIIAIIICVVLVAAFGLFMMKDKKEYNEVAKTAQEEADELNGPQNGISVVTYNGKKYKENTNIKSYLFIGIDEREDDLVEEDLAPGSAGQADCLVLLILDEETDEVNILQINRNAMTELDIYGELGNVEKTVDGQICLQYAYSTGGKRSCIAQEQTVEDLLFGIQIDGYFTLSLPGIADVNDSLGGVDVTMEEDYTWIDPSFTKGGKVHLVGEKATKFVQNRDTSTFNSVEDRMHRQTTYITNLVNSLKNLGGSTLASKLNEYIGSTILTDMKTSELNQLRQYTYNTDDVLYLPGEMTEGEEFEEYNVDNTKLQEMVIQLFYTEVEE